MLDEFVNRRISIMKIEGTVAFKLRRKEAIEEGFICLGHPGGTIDVGAKIEKRGDAPYSVEAGIVRFIAVFKGWMTWRQAAGGHTRTSNEVVHPSKRSRYFATIRLNQGPYRILGTEGHHPLL